MRSWAAFVAVLLLAGCGGTHHPQSARGGWRAVLVDASDGHLKAGWSCGSLRAAFRHLPPDPPSYSTLPVIIDRATATACDAVLTGIHTGAAKTAVIAALGRPDTESRCWIFYWPAADLSYSARFREAHPELSSVEGARFCFEDQRVTSLQIEVHA